ncbi:MAG TPA: ThuA domain-containing protein [Thermoanaerobaculia bacterium]|nr:ThuA domain-containing protein [Thermoanaerobaculia bacterium]
MHALILAAALALPARAVVVTVTHGFRHESIETAERTIAGLAERTGLFTVTFARDDADLQRLFTPAALQETDIVFFINTTGELPLVDRDAFLQWIEDGGAFIGTHSASDTFHDFPPYLEMLGGEFDFHGDHSDVQVFVEERDHPATRFLPSPFTTFDEIYRFKRYDPARVQLLLALHADPDSGEPSMLPLSWSRLQGRGRVFYTALGHREEVWEAEWFRQHLIGAVAWTLGVEEKARRRAARR